MKYWMAVVWFILGMAAQLAVGGCATTAQYLHDGVDRYCDLDPFARGVVEGEVNRAIAPNTLNIGCNP